MSLLRPPDHDHRPALARAADRPARSTPGDGPGPNAANAVEAAVAHIHGHRQPVAHSGHINRPDPAVSAGDTVTIGLRMGLLARRLIARPIARATPSPGTRPIAGRLTSAKPVAGSGQTLTNLRRAPTGVPTELIRWEGKYHPPLQNDLGDERDWIAVHLDVIATISTDGAVSGRDIVGRRHFAPGPRGPRLFREVERSAGSHVERPNCGWLRLHWHEFRVWM